LLTYCVFRPTQLPTLSGWEMSSILPNVGYEPSVAEWGGGMSTSCIVGEIVR